MPRARGRSPGAGRALFALCLVLWLSPLTAADAPHRPPAHAVASAHPAATAAGLEILKAGGNAFDAAVAVTAALAVVEPAGSGLGGGGFLLLHRARDGFEIMLDARERAPHAARADMYLDAHGEALPRASLDGALAAGIPGTPAALAHLSSRYGRLSLRRSLQPAIRLAREGFPVSANHVRLLRLREQALRDSDEAERIFFDDGFVPEPGFVLRQSDLARTLERIAAQGAAGFYDGATARALVEGARKTGGIWALEDLRDYRVVERAPVKTRYRGLTVTSAALPSSGGTLLSIMLGELSARDPDRMEALAWRQAVIAAMRAGYRARTQLGDPDVAVSAQPFCHPAMGASAPPRQAGENTTHFSILDREGNRVAATLSLNLPFGSGVVAPGTGVLLNNQMDDFVIKPGVANVYGLVGSEANAIAPGKRPLSSMTPTFIESEDAVAVLGTPGGSRIPSMVLLALLEFARGERDPLRLVTLPRYHHQDVPDRLEYERGAFTVDQAEALAKLGYKLVVRDEGYGNMQAVIWERRRARVTAASDPRGEGAGVTN